MSQLRWFDYRLQQFNVECNAWQFVPSFLTNQDGTVRQAVYGAGQPVSNCGGTVGSDVISDCPPVKTAEGFSPSRDLDEANDRFKNQRSVIISQREKIAEIKNRHNEVVKAGELLKDWYAKACSENVELQNRLAEVNKISGKLNEECASRFKANQFLEQERDGLRADLARAYSVNEVKQDTIQLLSDDLTKIINGASELSKENRRLSNELIALQNTNSRRADEVRDKFLEVIESLK